MRITIEEAAARLLQREVVAVPTETVYGLAACVNSAEGVDKVFQIKGRPSNNPLIIHISDIDQLEPFGCVTDSSFAKLTDAFWPGPLTLVLPIDPATILETVRAKLSTAAFRMPKHPIARSLLYKTGPLVMPSANLSGKPSSTEAAHVEIDFGEQFPVLDGGECACGLESTVMTVQNGRWVIIRQGILVPEDFASVLGYAPEIDLGIKDKPICPGQLYRHYAPKAKLILSKTFEKGPLIGFSDREYPENHPVYYLGASDDPQTVAENLYRVLRRLDEDKIESAYVDMRFEETGLFKTVAERLKKAAS